MAFYGLKKPYIAKYNANTGTYSDGFKCGKAINITITPNYAESKLYGDDETAEYEKVFSNANVNFGTTTLPIRAAEVMFGHEVDEENNKRIVYKAGDASNDVGFGFVVSQTINGVRSFIAKVVINAKFAKGAEEYTTKGENIEFKTPSVEGVAVTNANSEWMFEETYDTPEAAEARIKEYLNIE